MVVQFGFYALSVIAFLMCIALLRYAHDSRRLITTYLLGGLVWLMYVIVISYAVFCLKKNITLRIPLLIVITAILAGIVFTGRHSFRSALNRAPLDLPVFLTSY